MQSSGLGRMATATTSCTVESSLCLPSIVSIERNILPSVAKEHAAAAQQSGHVLATRPPRWLAAAPTNYVTLRYSR